MLFQITSSHGGYSAEPTGLLVEYKKKPAESEKVGRMTRFNPGDKPPIRRTDGYSCRSDRTSGYVRGQGYPVIREKLHQG